MNLYGESVPPGESEFEYDPGWGGPDPVLWLPASAQVNHDNLHAHDLSPHGQPAGVWAGTTPQRNVVTDRGRAYRFNSSDDQLLFGTPVIPGDLTIAFSIRPASTTTPEYISDFGGGNEFACVMGYQNAYYNIYGDAYPIDNDATKSQIPMSGAGVWDYVIWTKQGTTLAGYVNGELEASGTITHGSMTPSAGLKIGSSWADRAYAGMDLGDFALWNGQALIAAQVRLLYESSLDGSPGCMARPIEPQVFLAAAAAANRRRRIICAA